MVTTVVQGHGEKQSDVPSKLPKKENRGVYVAVKKKKCCDLLNQDIVVYLKHMISQYDSTSTRT
jgi:hypothetical protein